MNRFEEQHQGASLHEPTAGELLCARVETYVQERPMAAVGITAAAGLATGLLVSGMASDILRATERRGFFSQMKSSIGSGLWDALPDELKEKLS